jgi:S-adenosyl methyltransferase
VLPVTDGSPDSRPANGTPRDRHLGAALSPDLELQAGRQDNYPVDRAAGNQYREVFPEIVDVARASRQFLTRAVRYLGR